MSTPDDPPPEPLERPALSRDDGSPDPNTLLLRSDELFQGRREVLILHGHEVYRLRLTRFGKLILTK